MRPSSAVTGVLIMLATVLLVIAAALLVIWALVVRPYGVDSLTYVVSPTLALACTAFALVWLRIAQRRRQR
jgi:hypothetical protein